MTQTLFPITDRPVLPTSVLATIVDGLAVAETLWRPLVRHDPAGRTSVRLLATEAYDVWLLGWWPGQKVELHDHGPAAAAIRVVEGTLVDVSAPDDGPIRRTRVGTGALHRVEAGVAHSVEAVNVGLATSLHAYSPPLAEMGFREGRAVRHEPISWEAPVLAGTAGPVVHPSIRSEVIGG